MKLGTLLLAGLLGTAVLAQDKAYNTDQLKAAKRITADQWKQLQDASNARSQQFVSTTKGTMDYMSQQLGYTILKQNQSLNLTTEVLCVFDNVASAGQNNAGVVGTRNQKSFKLGPGKFEITNGVVKRLN